MVSINRTGSGKMGQILLHPKNAATADPHTFFQKHPTESELHKRKRIKKTVPSGKLT
jgi:hypothetical protein